MWSSRRSTRLPSADRKPGPAIGWLQEQGVLDSCDDLYNATLNIRAALAIYRYGVDKHGNGWGPWASAKDAK